MSKHSRALSIITASFAVSALLLTACSSNTENSTPPAAGGGSSGGGSSSAAVAKVDSIAALVPDKIKSAGKLIVGVNVPYTPNEFKDSSGKIVGFDVDLLDAAATVLGLKTEYRAGGLRQDHPGYPGGHLRHRHVLVHRQQGAREDRRLRHLLQRRHPCGRRRPARPSTRTTRAA